MPHKEQFTEMSERRVKMAVKRIHERNKRDRKAFGDRKFDTIADMSTEDEMMLYRQQRSIPAFWDEQFRTEAGDLALPPGFLPRQFVDSMFAQEAKHLTGETVQTNGDLEPTKTVVEVNNDVV